MNHRSKSVPGDAPTCEKYLSKLIRQEKQTAIAKAAPLAKSYGEKVPQKPVQSMPAKPRSKLCSRNQSPVQRITAQVISSIQKENEVRENMIKVQKREREAWGQILKANKSREKVSNFSNFDPLRTVHFLTKELYTKLEEVIPQEDEILQMVTEIRHALKRIPPEVSALLHNPQVEYVQDASLDTGRSTTNRTCQTPPTMYQEDTEKFQKIIAENTCRLESSCKQLEMVCTNLQNEKEMAEKELEQSRLNVEYLCGRVKELEGQIEEITTKKLKLLQVEKQCLEEKLERTVQDMKDNPTLSHLQKLVEELKRQKREADENCARLEYDMTLLKMEKEKLVTMLAIKDKEVKDIQEEMKKIQEQVNIHLRKLNAEVIEKADSLKRDLLGEEYRPVIGDTTVSSITTSQSDKESIKECGDADIGEKNKKPKINNAEIDQETLDELLAELTPSLRSILTPQ